ncbi:hypothetical protein T265_00830 [Opisthorchis viverrini]|uniref:Uncharacterized protein n=1 Tax=Opisthorchis viverrini TaxID=6198 RepID=A0A075ABV7_OPIVI|nr:hypothetical protein T265_00830 [Opisthorchis viverrini]KER33340.1 hypothetical protein T265_00830 [Opisthorchis viverrini]
MTFGCARWIISNRSPVTPGAYRPHNPKEAREPGYCQVVNLERLYRFQASAPTKKGPPGIELGNRRGQAAYPLRQLDVGGGPDFCIIGTITTAIAKNIAKVTRHAILQCSKSHPPTFGYIDRYRSSFRLICLYRIYQTDVNFDWELERRDNGANPASKVPMIGTTEVPTPQCQLLDNHQTAQKEGNSSGCMKLSPEVVTLGANPHKVFLQPLRRFSEAEYAPSREHILSLSSPHKEIYSTPKLQMHQLWDYTAQFLCFMVVTVSRTMQCG